MIYIPSFLKKVTTNIILIYVKEEITHLLKSKK